MDLRLPRVARLQLGYPALASALALRPEQEITAKDVFDTVVSIRRSKLPDPAAVPNAGSFFKNPVLEHQQATGIKSQFPDNYFLAGAEEIGADLVAAIKEFGETFGLNK